MLADLTTAFFWYGKWRTHEVAKTDGVPVVEVAKHYRVSRNSVHTWLHRHREEGLPGLVDRSHCAHQYPGRSAIEFEARGGSSVPLVSHHHKRRSARGNRVLVVSSLVSSIYARLGSSVFGSSICCRRSRTLTVFGELLSRVLKIGRWAVDPAPGHRFGERRCPSKMIY